MKEFAIFNKAKILRDLSKCNNKKKEVNNKTLFILPNNFLPQYMI